MTDLYLVKLVRDRVSEHLTDPAIHYREIPDRDEAIRLLRGKLAEEAVEYILDPSTHELADVQEVVKALAEIDLGVDWEVVIREADRKRGINGGFNGLRGMYCETATGKWS